MTEDERRALSPIISQLLNYQDDIEVLNRLISTSENNFGKDWRGKIPLLLSEFSTSEGEILRDNFQRALDYENGILAWDEANRLLEADGIDKEHIIERIPVLEYWLSIFGDAGKEVTERLKLLVSDISGEDSSDLVSKEIPPSCVPDFSSELLWEYEHFIRLKDYYDQTVSRVGARCVQLGGIEMSNYKYYGYVLDVLDEIVGLGEKLSDSSEYEVIIDTKFPGKQEGFRKLLASFKKELSDNAPPEMIEEEIDADKIRAGLGDLAKDEDEGPIGPAPDGFEPIPDLGDFEPVTDINTTAETVDIEKTSKENTVSIKPDVVRKVIKKVIVKSSTPPTSKV